jgi:hypothetical protein
MRRAGAPEGWGLIDWDGNPPLGLKCWRKKFGKGHVSVGVGDFALVSFSYGANSDDSYSGDRGVMTEIEAMLAVDSGEGKRMVIDTGPMFQSVSEDLGP